MGFLRSNRRKGFFLGAALCAAGLLTGGGLPLWFLFGAPPTHVPVFAEVRAGYQRSDAILRDRQGAVIHEIRVDLSGRRLDWVPLQGISPACVAAIIASEDKRFYSHRGVDVYALIHAVTGNLLFREHRGASTITMQLASMIDRRMRPQSKRRSWREKAQQMRSAMVMEKVWSKAEILEAYMNLVGFRGELRGIAAASRGLYAKEPGGLDSAESLILASLVRSPNAAIPRITERALRLNGILKAGLGNSQIQRLVDETMVRPYNVKPHVALAPHVAHALLGTHHQEVRSTLDSDLQSLATGLLKEQIGLLRGQNVNDGAILVVENRTGEILAYVGSSGPYSSAPWVDGVRSRRQAGSTLKPFLYALAFDKGILTAASVIDDSPLEIATPRGIYKPENYDNVFRGPVPARVALASSLNIPAVRVLMLTGEDDFVGKLRDLGFSNLRDGEHYGFSLALGALDVSLYDLTNAYRTLANTGRAGGLTLLPGRTHEKEQRAFSREASFIVSHILADRQARSTTFGFENPLATRFWSAAKTGTSKDMRDNWCVGFSERYTVGVWVGNFSGSPMWNVSGISGAAPIWRDIMGYLHATTPSRPMPPPPGVASVNLQVEERESGELLRPEGATPLRGQARGPRMEWFIKGTEPLSIEARPALKARPRILYPPQNLTIALDPDIPISKQKVFFEAVAPGRRFTWILNDKVIGSDDPHGWAPSAGAYTLKLVDEEDRLLDQVSFTVKN
jgi:penicillin-binding protein 1C